MKIEAIKVGFRHRHDLGDIDGLAASIADIGLLHPVVVTPEGEHSAKPDEVRRRIERLFPGPYLELYGRKSVPGWIVWGNEIRRDQFVIEVAA